MKAIQFDSYGNPDVLQVTEVDTPRPAAGEIVIDVAAAGVNPIDWKIRRGLMAEQIPLQFPAGLGFDAAGTVTAIGEGVTDLAVGDQVYGTGRSTYAEQAVLSAWAPIPSGISVESAAGWGSAVETAVRILDQLGIGSGQTVLVSGAAGGVGTATVRLAVARGATVIGTAGPANQDYLTDLGAIPVVYGDGLVDRVAAVAPNGVDAALDISGAGVLPELIKLTGDPAKVLSIADFTAPGLGAQVSSSSSDAPAAFAEAARTPDFDIPVDRRYPLAEAAAAQEYSEAGHVRGKIILTVE
ncbi:NADP-dependent oxidoreductase [Microlunatus soli]|uniref:NADPH:quinone reductase n=1 Tax=Microlunatus soli TaxID=630515 RepID=A0A1H1Z270_9ACTN|nr:NADP-dependent oxidoreductase [Microlunatus soli]SDT27286.1 NADPH:quinone reductase [Microlunatus soli]